MLDLRQVELLWAKDAARTGDSNPADESFCGYLIVFHRIEGNQCSRPAETGLAVDCYRAAVRFVKVVLARGDELVDDVLRWCAAVDENHVFVVDALVDEGHRVVLGVVQPDYLADLQVLEDVDVAGGRMTVAVHFVLDVHWTHEGHELAWDDPVKVAVLNLLIMLILLHVEGLEIVPAVLKGFLESLKTMKNCALVVTFSFAGVSVMQKLVFIRPEKAETVFSVEF